MIKIKIKVEIVILAIFITLFMYPQNIKFLANNIRNSYISAKLKITTIPNNKIDIDDDKTSIVFMFDDGWKSVYQDAYELMEKYGHKGSVSIIPSLIDEDRYMSYQDIAKLYLKGWDILNHSYSHKEDMYGKEPELLLDFNESRKWMKRRHLGKYSDMAIMPYGKINPYLINQFKDAEYHSIRTSDDIILLYKNNIEYYPVAAISLLTPMTVDEVKDLLTKTLKESKTILFILHKIGDEDDSFGMTYSKDKLEEIMVFINENSDKFQVITYSQLF